MKPSDRPLLIILPSWIGDTVMATPALRVLRDSLPSARLIAMVKPGIDSLIAGLRTLDEIIIADASGAFAPVRSGRRLRSRNPAAAIIFRNSFSSAVTALASGARRRIGYARDARSILLTDRIHPPRRPDGSFAVISAVDCYFHLARYAIRAINPGADPPSSPGPLQLDLTDADREHADMALDSLDLPHDAPIAILNPGANNTAKRWPADRFARVGEHLARFHDLNVLVTGSPAETQLCRHVASLASPPLRTLSNPLSLGSLMAIIARSRLMVTNDTGPRHIAAAFRIPVVTLFGPTDPRWTTIPTPGGEAIVVADPTLPPDLVADDHPDRCRIDRIAVDRVIDAADRLLNTHPGPGSHHRA